MLKLTITTPECVSITEFEQIMPAGQYTPWTYQTFTNSKSAIETLEKGLK